MGETAPARRRDALSLTTFVALGLPDGILGTAWPSMRHTLRAPVGDLGLILLPTTAGAVVVTAFVGSLIGRTGLTSLLAGGLLCAAAAAAGFAVAPVFGVVVGVAVLFGVGAGLIDGGLNTGVGLSGRGRVLNLLHGAYGVGTAIGPLLATAAIVSGSWRGAYLALVVADLVVAGAWLLERRSDSLSKRPQTSQRPQTPPAGLATHPGPALPPTSRPAYRYRRAVAAGIVVFFVYTGLEVSAGQWETTYGRDHLHLSASEAGLATFGYWGALTAVRFALALLPRPIGNQVVVRVGTGLALVAAALIWWQPGRAAAIAGFVILGAALAGVFPALIALTPVRLGDQGAQNAIAWQVGAAAAGGAGISALVGLFIGTMTLSVVGPAITILAVLLMGAEALLGWFAPLPH